MARNNDGLLSCERDTQGKVLWQNASCIAFCGLREGASCSDGCSRYRAAREPGGMHIHANAVVRDACCDLVFFELENRSQTVIELHENKFHAEFSLMEGKGLSKSEKRVVKMRIAGFPASQIASELFVSLSTVKTHLLHAYQKLGPELVARLRKPSP
jgi:DNA-binding CsgD family transcriptional regulator